MQKSVILLIIITLFSPLVLFAQQGGNDLFRAQFRIFNPIRDTRELFFMSAEEDREIRASFNGPSRRFSLESPSPELVFYRIEKEMNQETGEEDITRIPVGSVTLPAAGREYLILMIPTSTGSSEEYSFHIMEDGLDRFPRGNTRVFNLSSSPIAMQFGSAQFGVAPGSIHTISNREARLTSRTGDDVGARDMETSVRVGVNIEDEWRLIYRSIWYLTQSGRHQIYIIPSPRGNLRVVHTAD